MSEWMKTTNKLVFTPYDTTCCGPDTATECGAYTLQMKDGSTMVGK